MERLKKFSRSVFLAAQKVLVPAMLFLVYIFAVGALAALARVVNFLPGCRTGGDTFWEKISPGAKDIDEASGQS